MGFGNASAIGTLMECSARFVMLLHLPHASRPYTSATRCWPGSQNSLRICVDL